MTGADLVATGTVGRDETAPAIDQAPAARREGRVDAFLPWNDFQIAVSEGVDETALTQHLEFVPQDAPDAETLAFLRELDIPTDTPSWSGVTGVRTRFENWSEASDTPQLLRLTVMSPTSRATPPR